MTENILLWKKYKYLFEKEICIVMHMTVSVFIRDFAFGSLSLNMINDLFKVFKIHLKINVK